MIKNILLLFVFVKAFSLNAQYSVNGGLSTLSAFGNKSYAGFHLGGEFPRDNEVSLYLRASFYAKRTADPLTQGSYYIDLVNIDPENYTAVNLKGTPTFNYTTFDGGMRYYIMDGYDNGFALYGGSNVMGIVNKAKVKLDDFDDSKYRLPDGTSLFGTILNIGVGLSGGAKYTFPGIGSVYFDGTFDYLIMKVPSNQVAVDVGNMFFSPILFSFNIGFRKDFY